MKRSVIIKRLGYEASPGWTTYGTSLATISMIQVVATPHEGSFEYIECVTPVGGKFQTQRKIADTNVGKYYLNVYNWGLTGARSVKTNPSRSTVSPIVNSTGRLNIGPSKAKL